MIQGLTAEELEMIAKADEEDETGTIDKTEAKIEQLKKRTPLKERREKRLAKLAAKKALENGESPVI
jgi:hypothetical protein